MRSQAQSIRNARNRRHARVRKDVFGSGQRPRLAVYRSNRYIYAQVIDDVRGATLAAASSKEIEGAKLTVDTAKQVGELIARRAQDAGVAAVVFDRGGFKYHGRIAALADGAREAGLRF